MCYYYSSIELNNNSSLNPCDRDRRRNHICICIEVSLFCTNICDHHRLAAIPCFAHLLGHLFFNSIDYGMMVIISIDSRFCIVQWIVVLNQFFSYWLWFCFACSANIAISYVCWHGRKWRSSIWFRSCIIWTITSVDYGLDGMYSTRLFVCNRPWCYIRQMFIYIRRSTVETVLSILCSKLELFCEEMVFFLICISRRAKSTTTCWIHVHFWGCHFRTKSKHKIALQVI